MGCDTGFLLREARKAAALTQRELADRAETAQPAVAAYESGARVPTLATLSRLLEACDCDLDLVARPRVRRSAASLREVAGQIRLDLRDGREQDATRLLFGFADDFRGSSRPGKISLISEEPAPTGDVRFDAALAGLAEFFAAEAPVPVPEWVDGEGRFAEPWWFVTSRPAFHAYVLAHTPASFARHGVFLAREVFDRA
jgi:transcriptional regulator with XRE-family HTH domain